MKRKISFILAVVFLFVGMVPHNILAADISLLNNNTSSTYTAFSISNSGVATVSVEYMGYPNVTTNATITIKIEKHNLLVFWKDVVEDAITVNAEYFLNDYTYQLEDTGTYRCTVVYTVSGTGGADDVITFEDTQTYE